MFVVRSASLLLAPSVWRPSALSGCSQIRRILGPLGSEFVLYDRNVLPEMGSRKKDGSMAPPRLGAHRIGWACGTNGPAGPVVETAAPMQRSDSCCGLPCTAAK